VACVVYVTYYEHTVKMGLQKRGCQETN
jgi:hypothetical protein